MLPRIKRAIKPKLLFFLYKQNRFLSCSFQRSLSRTTEREASRILERTTWCLGQKSTSGGHCRHQRPLRSSNCQTTVFRVRLLRLFPGCGVSSWAKGPLGGWLLSSPPGCLRPAPHSAAPPLSASSSHTPPFFSPFSFPSSFFSVLSLRRLLFLSFPSSLSSGSLPYWHWKFPYSVSESRRTDIRWSAPPRFSGKALFWGARKGSRRMETFSLDPVSPALLCCDNFSSSPTLDSFIWMFLKYFHLPQRKKLSLAEHS